MLATRCPVLANPTGYATAFPDCHIINTDINAAGFGDINPFVKLLSGRE